MTIKTKLTLNIVIVIVIIAAVAVTSIVGMSFVKTRLTYLTERSTPFQMRTLELERAIQTVTADLIKIGASRNRNEYIAFKSEADKSLSEVLAAQQRLSALSIDTKNDTHTELSSISTELATITEGRLKANEDAEAANKTISDRLNETTSRLRELDAKIKGLQSGATASYSKSVDEGRSVSERQKYTESLRLTLKDFQLGVLEVSKATSKKGVLISQGKCNSAITKALQNELLKFAPSIASDLKELSARLPEFIKSQSAVVGQVGVDTSNRDSLAADISNRLNTIMLAAEQEGAMAADRSTVETRKQGTSFSNSNLATGVLAANSELVALGLNVEALITRLFTAGTTKDIDTIEAALRQTFSRSETVRKGLSASLAKLNARNESAMLKSAEGALVSINSLLFVKDGVIAKLRNRLEMDAKALAATGKLRQIVMRQAEKGKESVSVARSDQEKAITTVNRMVRFSTLLIIGISIGAVVFGITFGAWIYGSISGALKQLLALSRHVAEGDLSANMEVKSKDEIGMVQSSMGTMVFNLRDMAGKITDSTATIASSSEELSSTATELERSSHTQTSQIEQSVTAMTEMVQTIQNVSQNASNTSYAAGKMKQIATDGQKALNDTSKELVSFAEIVRQSAEKIEALGVKSIAINDIVDMIKDIADQTNLLALNASIEAARAGDMGRGFAVVADSVRQLAHRTIESSNEISRTVKDMQDEVEGSVAFMQNERKAIDKIVTHVDTTQRSMGEIVACVEQVFDMVQTIATSTEEQSATAEDVNRNMVSINEITRQLSVSVNEIKGTSEGFARLAADLNQMVGLFKL